MSDGKGGLKKVTMNVSDRVCAEAEIVRGLVGCETKATAVDVSLHCMRFFLEELSRNPDIEIEIVNKRTGSRFSVDMRKYLGRGYYSHPKTNS